MNLIKSIPVLCLLLPMALSAQVIPAPDTVTVNGSVFLKVETEANFPGGEPAWRDFLVKNLKAVVPVDNGAPVGKYTVIVKFVVSRDGSLSDIAAETNLGYGMEQEVIRLIRRSGNWKPAIQNGKPVNAYRRQPVTFLVEEDDLEITTKVPYTIFTGIDNKMSVTVKKVKSDNLSLTISQGTIIPTGDDSFMVRVTEPGRIIITIYNRKNNRKIGAASLEVKTRN